MTHDEQIAAQMHVDLLALRSAIPSQTPDNRVWWWHLRKPEPFEAPDAGPDTVVVVTAIASGLSLTLNRSFWRHADGEPLSLDPIELSDLLRQRRCVYVAEVPAPASHEPLYLSIALKMDGVSTSLMVN